MSEYIFENKDKKEYQACTVDEMKCIIDSIRDNRLFDFVKAKEAAELKRRQEEAEAERQRIQAEREKQIAANAEREKQLSEQAGSYAAEKARLAEIARQEAEAKRNFN